MPVRAPYLRFRIGDEWVTTKEVRIPIRRPVGVTYEQYGLLAYEEAWGTVRQVLDGGGE